MTQNALATQQNEAKGPGKSSTTAVDRVEGPGPHPSEIVVSLTLLRTEIQYFYPSRPRLGLWVQRKTDALYKNQTQSNCVGVFSISFRGQI